jgi:hypothetical protein
MEDGRWRMEDGFHYSIIPIFRSAWFFAMLHFAQDARNVARDRG